MAALGHFYFGLTALALEINFSRVETDKTGKEAHRLAFDWIINHCIEEISKDPEKYGMVINRRHQVPVEHQIRAQIPVLIEKRDLLNSILEKLYGYHQQNLKEDLSAGIPGAKTNLPTELGEVTKFLKGYGKYAIPGGLIGAGAAAMGIGWVIKRRNQRRAEKFKKTQEREQRLAEIEVNKLRKREKRKEESETKNKKRK